MRTLIESKETILVVMCVEDLFQRSSSLYETYNQIQELKIFLCMFCVDLVGWAISTMAGNILERAKSQEKF